MQELKQYISKVKIIKAYQFHYINKEEWYGFIYMHQYMLISSFMYKHISTWY